jgi:PAS domain S-box-containing protein
MVNLLSLQDKAKHFEVNQRNAELEDLTLSKVLIKQGGSDVDLKDLYSKTEKELQEERQKLQKQARLLDDKEKQINKQQKEIEDKQSKLESKEEEVRIQKLRLDSMNKEITVQRETVRKNMEILIRQEQKIKLQDVEYQNQISEMKNFESSLAKKKEEVNKINKDLQQKQKALGESHATIQTQKGIIYIFMGFIAVILILIFFVTSAWIKKQKINKQLNIQNIAINKQKDEILNQAKHLELINTELEKLSIVASKTDNAVTIMDAKGNFEWVNAGFTRLYGYTLQLLTHEKDENIIGASKNPEIKILLQRCIDNKESIFYENLSETRQGKKIWVQTSITPILNAEQEVIKLVSIDTDINKQKLAEREIREQHKMIVEQAHELERKNQELEKLSIVASETDNAILIMDAEGNFIWVNDAYTRMFGFTLDYLVNNISKNIIGPETNTEIKKIVRSCIRDKQSVDYEFKALTADKKSIWIHTTLTPISGKDGQIKNLVAIDTDISKLKEAEIEIRQQSEELIAQKEELRFQNDKIENQNVHIRASINYALTIQKAILPTVSDMNKYFESVVIMRPKDIVSGDFYWMAHLPKKGEFSEKLFFATVDCTGHGVPGAFMSMIGNRLLNEIVLESKIVTPKDILTELHKKVVIALKQNESDNNDGMDLCLIRIETNDNGKYIVKYSGAKRPLYYYQSKTKKLEILRADRKSIGGIKKKRHSIDFTNQEIILEKEDRLWLSTDGIVDQNANNRKRFGTSRFLKIIEETSEMSLITQKNTIEKELDIYQNGEEQRDDITVLGIKL